MENDYICVSKTNKNYTMLSNLNDLMAMARKDGNAIGMFDVTGLDTLEAIIGAAEELKQPVIISHAEMFNYLADIDLIGPAMVKAARRASVPVCVHLDHGETMEFFDKAIELGFTSVMIDASLKPYEENVAITKAVVEKCHKAGLDVEAELGRMPAKEGSKVEVEDPRAYYTDPEEAARFARETGVDALAIAFGTVHGLYKKKPVLDFDVIKACSESTGLPLVMHGGSGVSPEDYVKTIKAGIRKINYYTYMSKAGYEAAHKVYEANNTSYFHDVVRAAVKGMQENVKTAMEIFHDAAGK